jgi:hypothetical protein
MIQAPKDQPHDAHDVALHPEQLDDPEPEVLKSPAALLKLQADMSLVTSDSHWGHDTVSLPKTSFSN